MSFPLFKLEDDGPTNTITFETFISIRRNISAQKITAIALPEGEGRLIIFLGQYLRTFKVNFRFKDGATTAAAQRDAFEDLLLAGGDDDFKFTLTFEREESTQGSQITES